jgi:hypothetical protein
MSTPAKPETALVPQTTTDLMTAQPQAGKLSRLAAFTPTNLTEAIALSKLIANSELAPKDFKGKPANVLIAMQMGAEVGLAPMAALQNIAVINGRPSIWGDAALGIVVVHPEYEWHKEGMEGETAWFTIKRKGQEAYTTKFTKADAVKAQLWNKAGPWQTYPSRMLQMRARGFGIRDKFPDALRGLGIAEEVMDIPKDASPAKQRREEGTLDVGGTIADLAPSSEVNRGHNDTGLQRSKAEQSDAKQSPTMCADCGKIDGHEPTCKYFAQAEQDRKTSKATQKGLYLILSVEERTTKKKQPYLVLNVVVTTPEGDQNGKLYVWNKALHGYLVQLSDKKLVGEVSESEKDGKPFVQLEHILELNGVAFVNDLPAQQGTLEIPAEQSPEEDF